MSLGLGFQHLPRDLANVNAGKTMFDSYIVTALSCLRIDGVVVIVCYCFFSLMGKKARHDHGVVFCSRVLKLQSTLIILKSKGLFEIL